MADKPTPPAEAWTAVVAAAKAKGILYEGFSAFANHASNANIDPLKVSKEHLRDYRIFLLEDDVDPNDAGCIIADIRRTILLLQVDPDTKNLITSERIRPPRGARKAQQASLSLEWQRDLKFIETKVVGHTKSSNQSVVRRFVLSCLEVAAGFDTPISNADEFFQLETYVALDAVGFGTADHANHHAAAYRFLTHGKQYHEAVGNREELVDAFIAARKRLQTLPRKIAPSVLSRVGQVDDNLWTRLQGEALRRMVEAAKNPESKRTDDAARIGLFVTVAEITGRDRIDVVAAEFASPLSSASDDATAAAILVGKVLVPFSPMQMAVIAHWRRTRSEAWGNDHMRVFARRDGTVPIPSAFSTGARRFCALFGVDITPRTVQLEAVRMLTQLRVPAGQIQSHLGIQQKINFQSRFNSLFEMDSAERFGDAVRDAASGKDPEEDDNA
jgi:hypothetical protein